MPSDMEFLFGFNVSTSQIAELFEQIVEEMYTFYLTQEIQSHRKRTKSRNCN